LRERADAGDGARFAVAECTEAQRASRIDGAPGLGAVAEVLLLKPVTLPPVPAAPQLRTYLKIACPSRKLYPRVAVM
jgi:hypothetical protein